MASRVSPRRNVARAGAAARDVIHLVNPLWDPHGGSDWRAVEMYEALRAEHPVRLWSRFQPAGVFVERYPIELIRPWLGRWPVSGTFVFIGAYFRIGHWFKAAFPRRTILIYNTHQPDRLAKVLGRLESWHRTPVEIVYTSPLLRRLCDRPGPVIESPIDLRRFVPHESAVHATRPFTVGRLSRDIATKHHRDDPEVYHALAQAGVRLRLMGAICMHDRLDRAVEVLPAGAQGNADFLHGLDCFVYRTSDRWLEAFGRVVFEAMACGLPVVCGRRGGYADYIAHGINGFLFDTNEQAVNLILRLRDDAALRERIGRAARQSVEDLYRSRAWRRKLDFFLPSEHDARPARLLADALDPTPSEIH